MPSRPCEVCGRAYTVLQKNWNLINYDGPFVCSEKCTFKWVHSQPEQEEPSWSNEAHMIRYGMRAPSFATHFEEVFSTWLTSNGFEHEYEFVGFTVGEHKVYIPDFLVRGHWCLLETKGKWGLGQKNKMRMFRKEYPSIPLLVIPWVIRKEFRYGRVNKSGLPLR